MKRKSIVFSCLLAAFCTGVAVSASRAEGEAKLPGGFIEFDSLAKPDEVVQWLTIDQAVEILRQIGATSRLEISNGGNTVIVSAFPNGLTTLAMLARCETMPPARDTQCAQIDLGYLATLDIGPPASLAAANDWNLRAVSATAAVLNPRLMIFRHNIEIDGGITHMNLARALFEFVLSSNEFLLKLILSGKQASAPAGGPFSASFTEGERAAATPAFGLDEAALAKAANTNR
ncbi:MAG: hypothetical protein H6923_03450 [Alphaproteobacteria bacterium]|nr:hypothetical protein [Alphaproteobacteria bacterium]